MKKTLLILAAVLTLASSPARAADVQLVANPSVSASELSADDVKDIFLGGKTSVSGTSVEPVLAQSGTAHEVFLKAYIGKSDQALRSYFKSLVFTGKGSMPKSFGSDAEILKYVASKKGAIGYVSASADTAGVKKIAIK